jgi:hypothetical protein
MATGDWTFTRWLQDSAVPEASLTDPQRQVLEAAFRFLQQCGRDYFSRRLLSHFLLHAQTGLKVAQIARLLDFSRSAASAQQGLSSKEVVQAAHHRLAGRAHGKLLPRFAGPIAQFLCAHPEATRWDLLDFIQRTWGVSVSRMALHRFLKKYGLDQASRIATLPTPAPADATPPAPTGPAADTPPEPTRPRLESPATWVEATAATPPTAGILLPPQDFFLPPPSTPAPSCSCPEPSTGWPSPRTVSRIPTARCSAAC